MILAWPIRKFCLSMSTFKRCSKSFGYRSKPRGFFVATVFHRFFMLSPKSNASRARACPSGSSNGRSSVVSVNPKTSMSMLGDNKERGIRNSSMLNGSNSWKKSTCVFLLNSQSSWMMFLVKCVVDRERVVEYN